MVVVHNNVFFKDHDISNRLTNLLFLSNIYEKDVNEINKVLSELFDTLIKEIDFSSLPEIEFKKQFLVTPSDLSYADAVKGDKEFINILCYAKLNRRFHDSLCNAQYVLDGHRLMKIYVPLINKFPSVVKNEFMQIAKDNMLMRLDVEYRLKCIKLYFQALLREAQLNLFDPTKLTELDNVAKIFLIRIDNYRPFEKGNIEMILREIELSSYNKDRDLFASQFSPLCNELSLFLFALDALPISPQPLQKPLADQHRLLPANNDRSLGKNEIEDESKLKKFDKNKK